MSNLRPYEIILILLVILLLFGAKRLPDAARGLGRSLRIFKAETKSLRDDETPSETGYSDTAGPRVEPRPIEHSRVEQPLADQPRVDQYRADQPRYEEPRAPEVTTPREPRDRTER